MYISTNYVRIWFTTDLSVTSTGFDIYLAVVLKPTTTMLSPNVTQVIDITGANYVNNMSRDWVLDLRNRTDVLFVTVLFEAVDVQVSVTMYDA